MRRLGLVAMVLLILLGLGGCTVIFQGGTPVTATVGRTGSVATHTLSPGSVVWYQVTLPQTAPAVQAAYFELTKQLNLTLYEADQTTVYASSSVAGYFERGTLGLSSVSVPASPVKPQDINAQPICAGSCIIHPANASTFWVRVENQTGSTQTFSLYAYVKSYQDTGETGNNSLGGAVSLPLSSNFNAALETIGDQDYYTFQSSGTFSLTGCTSVDFQAVVHFSSGSTRTVSLNGTGVSVSSNDYAVVSSASGNDAAQASACSYYANLQ